jgi:hypothetical protein
MVNTREGWAGIAGLFGASARLHYFQHRRSLCGHWMLFEAGKFVENPPPTERPLCVVCSRRLDRMKKKR